MLKLPVIGNVDCKSKIKVTESAHAQRHVTREQQMTEVSIWCKFLADIVHDAVTIYRTPVM